ncbi:S1C family serine protease [Paenibacillus sp. IITD108]|uniref:S1C family serine protease n=1 Tax=Paenibacillus sp. IITD108 TaxID=3116649 RepID=UPI002F423253
MDDQNKKNYDDFFRNEPKDNSSSNNETNRLDQEQQQDYYEQRQESTEQGADTPKSTAYYYSYGPSINEKPQEAPQQDTVKPYTYEAKALIDEPQRQFKASTNGSWKVVKEPKRRTFRSMFLSFLAGALVVGGLMYAADTQNWFTNLTAQQPASSAVQGGGVTNVNGAGSSSSTSAAVVRPNNIAELSKQASPAVVKIETYVQQNSRRSSGSIFDDSFFRQFFGDDYRSETNDSGGGQSQRVQTGMGTGFFFKEDGHILTNQHVVGDAEEILVTVQGYDEPLKAKLLGSSYDLDLAVLKVEGKSGFPTLPLGDSDNINIGDWVVAIGNPYGFDLTTTVGVISAKERPIDISDTQGERHYKHLLQTDASINPGNSGGPLLNINGEVVGINTAVSAQAQGIGFAIPTSTVKEVLDNLINNKEIPKEPVPFIGADLSPITESMAQQLGLKSTEGALVKNIYYNTPAFNADLKQYDVIIGIEGTKYKNPSEFVNAIKTKEVGSTVQFNVIRGGKEITIDVVIGDKNKFGVE